MNHFISSFLIALTLILTNELGDRTFLLTVIFCFQNSSLKVFFAAFLGLLLNSIISIAFGRFLLPILLEFHTIELLSSAQLLLFGIWMILSSIRRLYTEESENENLKGSGIQEKKGFFKIFSIILITEFGDRSQLATFTFSASYVILIMWSF